MLHTHM